MDCEEFDDLVQAMMDCRRVGALNPAAERHRQVCQECAEYYATYRQLIGLTETAMIRDEIWRAASRTSSGNPRWDGSSPRTLETAAPRRAPLAVGNVDYPVAYAIPRRARRSWSQPLATLSVVAACLGAIVIGSHSLPDLPPAAGPETPLASFSAPSHAPSQMELARDTRVDATWPRPVSEFGAQELRELTKNWDQSVVALDRGWQRMAVGRVRAHQIPGIQPAVYPITGAVEAFRKNMIVRNQNGLAAGLRW